MFMKKVTLQEQQSRIKSMMGINEQMERNPEDITFASVGDPDVDSETEMTEEDDEMSSKPTREDYEELVNKKCADYGWDVSYHVKDVMISMLMTRDEIWMGGDFTQAVLADKLGAAVRRADDEMVKHLKHMVIARDNFYLGQEW